jgi:hypothetical protein
VDEERQREQQGDKARADRAAVLRQKTVQEADRKQTEEEDQELHAALMAFKKKESERQRRAAEKKEADDETEEIRLQVKRFKEAEREREREGGREREREEDAARTKEDKERRIKEQDEASRRKTEGEEAARRNAVADEMADEPKMRMQETVSQPKQTADKRKTGMRACVYLICLGRRSVSRMCSSSTEFAQRKSMLLNLTSTRNLTQRPQMYQLQCRITILEKSSKSGRFVCRPRLFRKQQCRRP